MRSTKSPIYCRDRRLNDFRSFVRSRKIERTMKRTVRQLVARTPCPYRGLDDFRSFVRRRKVVRTRRRTPHPSAFGCHLPPLGKALGKCEHRMKPKDSADNLTAGCKHTPLRSVASLLRKHCPRPTALNEISFVGEGLAPPD